MVKCKEYSPENITHPEYLVNKYTTHVCKVLHEKKCKWAGGPCSGTDLGLIMSEITIYGAWDWSRGWLVQANFAIKKLEPQVQFFNIRTPLVVSKSITSAVLLQLLQSDIYLRLQETKVGKY